MTTARGRTRLFSYLIGAMLAHGSAVQSGAQTATSQAAIDNLKHPPGTATSPPGQLGRVEKSGRGPVPMVLIPGAAFGAGVWKEFMKRNGEAYTMYAITPAGYEGTNPPPWPATNDFGQRAWTDALCGAVVKLIEDEKLDRPVLVGHHMLGDHYALRIALDHSDKVRGVVVIAGMPSMAFPAWGENQPGKPVKTAGLEQRKQLVQQMWAPFYRTVTEKVWKAGSFQARLLSNSPERGARLFAQQVAVPIPTQVRYFLEYQTTDLDLELEALAVPLLVVLPKREWTFEAALDAYRESNEAMYGDREKAREAWTKNLVMAWGSVDEGVKWMNDTGFRWERLRGAIPRMTIRAIENTGVFVMDDQPEALDREIMSFVEGAGK